MIGNFDEVKKQLSELSEVINKFNSEAVQLKIVEIVLGGEASYRSTDLEQGETSAAVPKPRRRKATRNKTKSSTDVNIVDGKPNKKARSSGQGAVATLSDLVDQGFFKESKTINEIVSHCEEKLARRFRSNEFSGKLGRLTREGVLDRTKNGDGQYEYTQT